MVSGLGDDAVASFSKSALLIEAADGRSSWAASAVRPWSLEVSVSPDDDGPGELGVSAGLLQP